MRTSKVKERSGRTVTRAGTGTPGVMCAVRALNSFSGVSPSPCQWPPSGTYLAEIHALDTLATKSRADRRTRTCLASSNDKFNDLVTGNDVLGHSEL